MKTIPHTYELVKDEQSMNLIKIQNKKINSLINQLEQNESLLRQYESKLSKITDRDRGKGIIQITPLQYQNTSQQEMFQSIDNDIPYDTIKLTNLIKENSLLATKVNQNGSTIQKLNETITAQNNKIDSLLTRINDLNSIISNQESTIGVINKNKSSIEKKRSQDKQMQENAIQKLKEEIEELYSKANERDNINKQLIRDNQLFNEKYEDMNKKIKDLIEENRSIKGKRDNMSHELQKADCAIQNYKSKLNQFEYVINSKDNYHQDYINDIETIAEKYSTAMNQIIEWGNSNIGVKGNMSATMPPGMGKINGKGANDSGLDYEYKLKMVYDNIVHMTTSLNSKIREEYGLYEKELQEQQNLSDKYIEQIKEMSKRIQFLEQEINQLRDQADDQGNNYAINEAYYQKSIDALNKKLQHYDLNINLVIKECLRQFRDNLPIHTHNNIQDDDSHGLGSDLISMPSLANAIELAKEKNPLNAIELLFNNIIDYCKWLINDNLIKKKLKNENEVLFNENQKIIEENQQLKRTIQTNAKQFNMEKMEILNQFNQKKSSEVYEKDKAYAEEIGLLKEFIANHEEDNERVKNDHQLLKSQYHKLEKAYEDLKKNQKQYEEHLLLQNEEMHLKCKELEESNLKLKTDIEIGNMQLGHLKNALQEQIEQTKETLTNYSTTN